jgi:hypothetical protein
VTPPPSPLPNGAVSPENNLQGVPEGTTFNVPSQITAVQALTIIATVYALFAAIAGCIDGSMTSGSKLVAFGAVIFSLISFVFGLSAYCVWTVIPYVTAIQATSPSVWMPVWTNQGANQMTAIQVYDTWLGPGWATALTASILTFIAMVIHCISLREDNSNEFEDVEQTTKTLPPAQKEGSLPTSIPASAVNPAQNQPVPPAVYPPAASNIDLV